MERVTRIELALSAWEASHGAIFGLVDLGLPRSVRERVALDAPLFTAGSRGDGHGTGTSVTSGGYTISTGRQGMETSYDPYYNSCYVCGDVQD